MTVSPQPEVLRLLHRLLSEFGYDVFGTRELSWMMGGVQYVSPQFLLVDSDALKDGLRSIAEVRSQHPAPYPYILLLNDDNTELGVADAIEAGVDDFLEKPICNAEVLTRLRAGARYLESRLAGEGLLQTDQTTGLMTQTAFDRLLRRQDKKTTTMGCLVLAEIDYFEPLNTALGWEASSLVLQAVAELMRELCGDKQVAAKMLGGRFGVLLPGTTLEQARRWAERLRERIATCDLLEDVKSLRLSTSLGIGSWQPGVDSVDDLISRAERALQLAIQSGRDCSVFAGEVESVGGNGTTDPQFSPFANAKAGDVMTPAVLVFDITEKIGVAAAKLNRSRLSFIPVVDQHRRLQGIAQREDITSSSDACPVRNVTKDVVVRVREDTPLSAVMKNMTDNQASVAVVLQGEEPKGIITRTELTELMRPVSHGTASVKRSYFDAANADPAVSVDAPMLNSQSSFQPRL